MSNRNKDWYNPVETSAKVSPVLRKISYSKQKQKACSLLTKSRELKEGYWMFDSRSTISLTSIATSHTSASFIQFSVRTLWYVIWFTLWHTKRVTFSYFVWKEENVSKSAFVSDFNEFVMNTLTPVIHWRMTNFFSKIRTIAFKEKWKRGHSRQIQTDSCLH